MPLVDLVADVKPHLNIPTGVMSWDVELQGFIDAAAAVVEDIAGPVLPRVITGEQHRGGWPTICLRFKPVMSIQAVTEYVGGGAGQVLTAQPLGSTVDGYGYDLASPSGTIRRRNDSGNLQNFGATGVVVNYTVGYSAVPSSIRLGTLELIRHWYQSSQQGGRPNFNSAPGEDGGMVAGLPYAIPNAVAELLTTKYSSRRIGGIA